jgi:hypothetical protein
LNNKHREEEKSFFYDALTCFFLIFVILNDALNALEVNVKKNFEEA